MSDKLTRLTAAIVAEIRWHSLEAVRYRQAVEEQNGQPYEENWLNLEAAERHEEAAARLHAILHPKEPEE